MLIDYIIYNRLLSQVSMYTNWIHEIIESIPIIGLSDFNQQPNKDNIVV